MGHRLWFRRNAGQERLTFLSNLPETTLKSNEKCHFSGASVYPVSYTHLDVYKRQVPEHWAKFPDMHGRERLALAPVIGLMLVLGLVPQLIVDTVNPTVVNLLAHWRF